MITTMVDVRGLSHCGATPLQVPLADDSTLHDLVLQQDAPAALLGNGSARMVSPERGTSTPLPVAAAVTRLCFRANPIEMRARALGACASVERGGPGGAAA